MVDYFMGFGKLINVVLYEDSKVCVLISEVGVKKQFYEEFSRVTSQGYELKAVHTSHSFQFLGTGGDTGYVYYFQKLGNPIDPTQYYKNNPRKSSIPASSKKKTRRASKIIGEVKICKYCGNTNKLDVNRCRKCGGSI